MFKGNIRRLSDYTSFLIFEGSSLNKGNKKLIVYRNSRSTVAVNPGRIMHLSVVLMVMTSCTLYYLSQHPARRQVSKLCGS